jgi:hypothetical protein
MEGNMEGTEVPGVATELTAELQDGLEGHLEGT